MSIRSREYGNHEYGTILFIFSFLAKNLQVPNFLYTFVAVKLTRAAVAFFQQRKRNKLPPMRQQQCSISKRKLTYTSLRIKI